MYATDFEFDGKRLSDFGCILTTFDGLQSGAVPSGASITFSTASSLGSDIFEMFSSNYQEAFTTTFCISKNPCDNLNYDSMAFTPREASAIQRWLCRRNEYCKFKLLEDGYYDIYWNGYFTSQQYMSGSSIIGFELTFTASSPYAFLENIKLHYSCNSNEVFIVDSKSDEEGYVYPDVVITINGAGNFELANDRDNKVVQINNCTQNEIITISGQNLLISTSDSSHDLSQDFNFIFPKLYNSYDNTENHFTPSLSCTIDIVYAPVIKVGF